MNFTINTLAHLDSTQNFLLEKMNQESFSEGTVILAIDQYQGHGQDGNQWESEAGKNLTFSLLLKPRSFEASQQFKLNMAVALGVSDYLTSKTEILNPIHIKWPNDFYIGRKKSGGMILNNAVSGNELAYCIAGIGLNINQLNFTASCPNPTSLRKESGKEFILRDELNDLLNAIGRRYTSLLKGGHPIIEKDYLGKLFQRGIESHYSFHGNDIVATIEGVDEFGRLLLRQKKGPLLCCDLKEIRYIL